MHCRRASLFQFINLLLSHSNIYILMPQFRPISRMKSSFKIESFNSPNMYLLAGIRLSPQH